MLQCPEERSLEVLLYIEELQQVFNNVAQKIYQQNPGAAQGFDPSQAAGGAAQGGDDNVVDADYTVVDDDNK